MRSPSQQTPACRGLLAWGVLLAPLSVIASRPRAGMPVKTPLPPAPYNFPYGFLTPSLQPPYSLSARPNIRRSDGCAPAALESFSIEIERSAAAYLPVSAR